jgi:hypothetical protein
MARGNLVIDADALGRSAIRLYIRGGGTGICATGLVERGLDCRPAWPAVKAEMFAAEEILFESGGASGDPHDPNIPWDPNKGSYANWKSANFSNRPNVLTGALEAQLSGKSASNPPYIREGMTRFEFGSDAPTKEWSGRMVWWGDDELKPRDQDEMISVDAGGDEDVGGIQAQGGWYFWGIGKYLRGDDELAGPTHARPPISLGIEAMDSIVNVVMDWLTLAPLVSRGWFNPHTRSWMPGLRRAHGTPLVEQAGRVYRTSAKGNRRKIGEITT